MLQSMSRAWKMSKTRRTQECSMAIGHLGHSEQAFSSSISEMGDFVMAGVPEDIQVSSAH